MEKLIEKFIENSTSLSESELERLHEEIVSKPEFLNEMREAFVLDETLSHIYSENRRNLQSRVKNAILDLENNNSRRHFTKTPFLKKKVRSKAKSQSHSSSLFWPIGIAAACVFAFLGIYVLDQPKTQQKLNAKLLDVPNVIATFGIIHSKVEVLRGSKHLPACASMNILDGDIIRTTEDGTAKIKYSNESTTIAMSFNTELKLWNKNGSKHGYLHSGRITSDVAKQVSGHPMMFSTPNSNIIVLGTIFQLVTWDTGTRLDVEKGEVRIKRSNSNNWLNVKKGHFAVADEKRELASCPIRENGPIWRPSGGKRGGALQFNGIDDYVEVPHSRQFNVRNGTIAFWFKAQNILKGQQGLWSKDSFDFDTGGHLSILVNKARIRIRLQSTYETHEIYSEHKLESDHWYHIVFVFGISGMRLFVNGEESASLAYTGGLIGNAEPIVIGANTWASGDLKSAPVTEFFDGVMDDVRFYGRALNLTEIVDMAREKDSVHSDIIAHWKFNESMGSIAEDSSGNAHNGILSPTRASK